MKENRPSKIYRKIKVDGNRITKGELKPLVEYYSENQQQVIGIIKELKNNGRSGYFTLVNKKILFFDNYHIEIEPVAVKINTNFEKTKVLINGKEIAATNIKRNLIPGKYLIRGELLTSYGLVEEEKEVYIMENLEYNLNMPAINISLNSNFNDADVFINDENINKKVKDIQNFGPIPLNKNIKKINEDNLNSNLSIKGANDEIKELTISFNKMIAKLENAFASQKRFNSSVAHELKTPLAVIKTNIDVLKSSNCKSLEEYDKTLAVVEKSILKMNLIIETLLDIIRQENALLNEIVSIDEILEDIVDDLSIIANKKNIKLKLNSYNIKNKIKGNEIMLYRAFYNVIENSIKYNKINGSIDILCYQDLNTIEVKVIDTGSGIKEEDYDEIFKPFYRCEGINSYSKNGIGLGLSLTQSVIKLHGGEIKVKSKLNEGTEFTFILPYIV